MTQFASQCERTEKMTTLNCKMASSLDGSRETVITDAKENGVKRPATPENEENGEAKPEVAKPSEVAQPSLGTLVNLSGLQNAAVLQGLAGSIPMMIQTQGGVPGSAPLTLIYPLSSMATATATNTTTASSAGPGLVNPASVITVAPTEIPPLNATVTPPMQQNFVIPPELELPPSLTAGGVGGSQDTTINFQDLANAAMGSLNSAITNQIIMEIKSESSLTAPPSSQNHMTFDPATQDITSPEPPLTPDPGDDGRPKAKRPKLTGSGGANAYKEDKICRVCGDRALGCNFDAVSCESCKAFFRRNALKDKQPKCLFEGSCKIDLNTRRFCPHCRLQKCFIIGMKKELILREDEKKKRLEKVQMNRERRGKGFSSGPSTSVQSPLTPGPPTPGTPGIAGPPTTPLAAPITPNASPPSAGYHEEITLDMSGLNQDAASVKSASSPKAELPPTATASSGLLGMGLTLGGMSFSVAGSGLSQNSSLASTAGANSSGSPPAPDVTNLLSLSKFAQRSEMSSTVQLDTFLVRRLTAEENHMLQELMQVYDLSFTVDLEPLIHIKHLDPSLNQLVNQSSITVLRLIKFAKRLEEFVRLSQECQIGILKGTWIHILLLRSVSLYDSERDVWVTPKGDIPTEILKNATGFVKLHDDHVRYCKNIKLIIRDDLMIVVILLVIVLFSPEGPNVINREMVSNLQDKYLILLKHYLESKYTYVRAAEMYPALMSKLRELKELAEIHGKYLLDVNPSEIEPIMLEILDLK